jgi:hypothetical protein
MLIVDDELESARSLARLLRKWGCGDVRMRLIALTDRHCFDR